MKKILASLLISLVGLVSNAALVEVNIGDQSNPYYLSFDWYDDAHTMLMTSPADVEMIIDEKFEKRSDGCMDHIYNASIKGNSPHRGGATWQLSNNGIPAAVEVAGVSYPVVAIGDFSFAFGPGDIQYKIPSSIIHIGKGAFFNSTPQQIDYNQFTTIDDYAFYGNKTNGDIKLTNVEKLGKYAFANCVFYRVTIDGPLKEIGEGAFYNTSSSGIVSIYIGDNVEVIGDHAFDACTSMGNWGNTTPDGHSALYIGKNVRYIGNYAFHEIRNLEQELVIPDATTYIGDYAFCHCYKFCPITLGNNVKHIGAYAFYKANHMCSNSLKIPASVEYIGPLAFEFTRHAEGGRTNGITDLYVHATTPPDLGTDENDMCAFGDFDPNLAGFWDVDCWWMFPFVCLHVPVGSREDYINHPYWSKFTCIIDDVIPETSIRSSVQNIVGYVFMVPGESTDITPDNVPGLDDFVDCNIIVPSESTVIDNPEGTTIKANLIGQEIILLERTGNSRYDGGWQEVEPQIVGAVIVFVCPTVTMVYGGEIRSAENQPEGIKLMSVDNPVGNDPDYAGLTDKYVTYQHTVVPNLFPRFQIEPLLGVKVDIISRAKVDENGKFTEDGDIAPISEEQQVGELDEKESGYVVPINPIVENRVIQVTTMLTNDQDQTATGIASVQLNRNLKVTAKGLFVYIEGEFNNAVVYNVSGMVIKESKEGTIGLPEPGIYIIKIDDNVLKITVK